LLSFICNLNNLEYTLKRDQIGKFSKTLVVAVFNFVKLILKDKYRGYQQGLAELGLENLREKREKLCLEFAKRCASNEKLFFFSIFSVATFSHRRSARIKKLILRKFVLNCNA